jgi:hypothetical protein
MNDAQSVTAQMSADAKAVTLTFPRRTPPLNTAQLMQLVGNLAGLREQMKPEVTMDAPLKQQMHALLDPRWHSELDPLTGNTILAIRSPSLGWMSFVFPPHEVDNLITAWTKQRDARDTIVPKTAN